MAEASRNQSRAFIVFLPIGRDCRLVCDALKNAEVEAQACATVTDFLAALEVGVEAEF